MKTFTNTVILFFLIFTGNISAQEHPKLSVRDVIGAPAIIPVTAEPPAKFFVDPPIASELAKGKVFIQYRTENLRIVPVYGATALDVSPRIGHLHITVDNVPWHWADASNEPLIIVGFTPGKHTILFELADTTHKVLQQQRISFDVPQTENAHQNH